jgi:hypothetical protein
MVTLAAEVAVVNASVTSFEAVISCVREVSVAAVTVVLPGWTRDCDR